MKETERERRGEERTKHLPYLSATTKHLQINNSWLKNIDMFFFFMNKIDS